MVRRGSRVRVPTSACASVDGVEQLAGRGELEPAREDHDRLQSRRAFVALEQADLGAVQVAAVGELFLREAGPQALRADVVCKLLPNGVHLRQPRDRQTKGPQTVVCIPRRGLE